MHVILLERVAKLGNLGETVRVRDGFARNFLLPQGKALRATKENMSFLHPEVTATITLNIARSEDEANRQARGEDMTAGAREETFVREVGSVMDEEGGDEEA